MILHFFNKNKVQGSTLGGGQFMSLGAYVWDHCGAETKAVASQTLFQFYCLVDQNLMFSAFIT